MWLDQDTMAEVNGWYFNQSDCPIYHQQVIYVPIKLPQLLYCGYTKQNVTMEIFVSGRDGILKPTTSLGPKDIL